MFYKKRVVVQDTPAMVAERIAYRAACEQAHTELRAAFPTITPENFEAADTFRVRRISEIIEAASKARKQLAGAFLDSVCVHKFQR